MCVINTEYRLRDKVRCPWPVTGAAGFIGSHVALRLLGRGDEVVGLDNLNDYYSVQLKPRPAVAADAPSQASNSSSSIMPTGRRWPNCSGNSRSTASSTSRPRQASATRSPIRMPTSTATSSAS
ncbi:MAG: GDP-mannose 4,6-dehydratase [Planctomycetaceae bacterium]